MKIDRKIKTKKKMKYTVGTLPVKLIAARFGDFVIVSPKSGPAAGTKLITPAGRPASLKILYKT
jgi:hypothetical protein